jgi:hypothetical protein
VREEHGTVQGRKLRLVTLAIEAASSPDTPTPPPGRVQVRDDFVLEGGCRVSKTGRQRGFNVISDPTLWQAGATEHVLTIFETARTILAGTDSILGLERPNQTMPKGGLNMWGFNPPLSRVRGGIVRTEPGLEMKRLYDGPFPLFLFGRNKHIPTAMASAVFVSE